MPSTEKKLSKRDQKAQIFRSKNKKQKLDNNEPRDVPEVDEVVEGMEDTVRSKKAKPDKKAYPKKMADAEEGQEKAKPEKPRQQKKKPEPEEEAGEVAEEPAKGTGNRKRDGKAANEGIDTGEGKTEKKRFIAFVGNLPFDITKEELEKHFESAGGIISVRMMTDKVTKKPKGFSFIEFDNSDSMKKALFFHHTFFKKRQINVELTVGGGGNTEARTQKIKIKNSKFQEERQKIHEKSIVPAKAAAASSSYARNKGTEGEEDESTGGTAKSRSMKAPVKAAPMRRVKRAASGVNAIRSSVQRSWVVNSEE